VCFKGFLFSFPFFFFVESHGVKPGSYSLEYAGCVGFSDMGTLPGHYKKGSGIKYLMYWSKFAILCLAFIRVFDLASLI
jgi:hypothetical protein